MDPCAHGELGDEYVAPLGEKNRCFGRYHLDLWVCLHDLLDASQRELMDFVIVRVILEMINGVLPVRC